LYWGACLALPLPYGLKEMCAWCLPQVEGPLENLSSLLQLMLTHCLVDVEEVLRDFFRVNG
jgi:hypothetical protein